MNSKYSQLLGSFERTSDFPLEANYYFDTVDSLKSFYEDPINKGTLHKGLLKVVGNLDLYWVSEVEGELQFTKLISLDTLEELKEVLSTLSNSNKDIDELKEVINILNEKCLLLNVIVGTDGDISEFLDTLPYNSIAVISETLENLFELITLTKQEILGDVSEDYNTLEKLEDIIKALKSSHKHDIINLLTEINLTLVGVGLNSDGSFSPDLETNYLKNATSVMNALKTLDSLINQSSNNFSLEKEDTGSVAMNIVKELDKTTISARVKSAPLSDIRVDEDGLYHRIDSEYENGILTIKVNGNVRQQHILGLSSIVEDGYYDADLESIVIVFKLQDGGNLTVRIPTASLISEWEVDNSIPNKVVELTKERVLSGGADKLSADVRIASVQNNILEKDGNGLLVKGLASNIVYDGDVTVKSKLDEINVLSDKVDSEKERAITAESLINSRIDRILEGSDIKINSSIESNVKLTADIDGLSAQLVWGDYD